MFDAKHTSRRADVWGNMGGERLMDAAVIWNAARCAVSGGGCEVVPLGPHPPLSILHCAGVASAGHGTNTDRDEGEGRDATMKTTRSTCAEEV